MVDIIYKTENSQPETSEQLPKNFRQIGSPDGSTKLYIEDYVATYLQQMQQTEAYQTKLAVLFGQTKNTEQGMRVFVSAAIEVEQIGRGDPGTEYYLSDNDMAQIYKDMKEYLTGVEMLGWALLESSINMELSVRIEKTQRKYFPGRGRVFWHRNGVEQEEKLYVYERGILNCLRGYYIYYEKNPQMREYMVSQKERTYPMQRRETVSDAAAVKYRQKMVQAEKPIGKTAWQLGIYTASMGLMAAICIFGVTLINNYESMKDLEETLAAMSEIVETEPEVVEEQIDAIEGQPSESEEIDKKTMLQEQSAETQTEGQAVVSSEDKEGETDAAVVEEGDYPDDAGTGQTEANKADEENQTEQTQESQVAGTQTVATTNENQVYLDQGYYIVQPGDRLADISLRLYNTDTMVSVLCEKNGIEDIDKIYAGQKLILP